MRISLIGPYKFDNLLPVSETIRWPKITVTMQLGGIENKNTFPVAISTIFLCKKHFLEKRDALRLSNYQLAPYQ